MRSKLLQLLTRNGWIKLAALALSLMLYVAVHLQQPVTDEFEIALTLELPPGRTLQQKLPKVRAQISGRGSQVLKLRTLRGDVTRRIPDTLSGTTWTMRLEPSEVEALLPTGADVRVLDIRPREITVALDSVARKDVPIVSRVTVTPDSDQVLQSGPTVAPAVARLLGPDKILATIDSVVTVPVEITDVAGGGPFERTVPIDTTSLGIVRVVPKQVTVTGTMVVLAERTFRGVPVETGAGAAIGLVVTPARVAVTVRGPEDRVQALTADSLRVVAVARGDGAARLTLIVPRGLAARATPDSVTIRRRTRRG